MHGEGEEKKGKKINIFKNKKQVKTVDSENMPGRGGEYKTHGGQDAHYRREGQRVR